MAGLVEGWKFIQPRGKGKVPPVVDGRQLAICEGHNVYYVNLRIGTGVCNLVIVDCVQLTRVAQFSPADIYNL